MHSLKQRPGRNRSGRPFRGQRFSGAGRRAAPKKRARDMFDPSIYINNNPAPAETAVYDPKHAFADFALDRRLERAVTESGLRHPSPIQDEVIPLILNGCDVVGLAETGTGKTAAFLIPLIHKTLSAAGRETLILTPTRELAIQIEAELRKLTRHCRLYATVTVGGTNIRPQIRALRQKNHFVIGTPGRVLDLIQNGHLKAARFRTVVLDEADRMLDMGFIGDIRKIIAATPADRETLFFSATMTREAERLVGDFLREPRTVSVKKKDITGSIAQDVVRYDPAEKFAALVALLRRPEFSRVIVFGAMKHSVEKLARQLSQSGIRAESIHGDKSHHERQRSLRAFKEGRANVLVATDVAARGIHVDDVSHVINYDLPNTFEDYVHRIGRTGRGHKRGAALTFVPVA